MGCRAFALLPVPPCVVACGAAGVPGVGPGLCVCRWCSGPRARPLCVPVGGGPPASRPRCELRSARRLEARPGPATAHRHGGRSLRHPTHRLRLACWRVAQRVGSLSDQALPPPTGTAAGPSGTLHTGCAWRAGVWPSASARCLTRPRHRPTAPRQIPPAPFAPVRPGVLMCGWARRLEARPGSSMVELVAQGYCTT